MAVGVAWLLVALVLPLFLFLWERRTEARRRLVLCGQQLPGPMALPLIGNLIDIGLDTDRILETLKKIQERHGGLVRLWLGPQLFVLLSDPRDIEALLSKNKNMKKSFNYKFVQSWLGLGLLTSSGERWKKHRKIITPAFHFTILEQFVDIFNKQGDVLLSILKKKEGKTFDISPLIDLYTQDVICETAMGVELHAQTESYSSSYLKSVREMCEVAFKRTVKPWLYPDFTYRLSSYYRREKRSLKIIHTFTNEVIKRKRKQLQNDPTIFEDKADDFGRKKKLAFLDLLLRYSQDGDLLSDEDIREEVDTFMFEGHDTTTSAISFALMELSKHPDIQDKVLEELKDVASDNNLEDLSLNLEALNRLKYLEQVIKETLRMYPSVPMFGRQTTEDYELSTQPVIVPPGVTVVIAPALLHGMPANYSDPEVFNPDNFSAEAASKRHPYAYIPFSAGSRNCIGQKFAMLEIKSVLAKIIWNYSLQIDPTFALKIIPEVTLKSFHGIRLSVVHRSKN